MKLLVDIGNTRLKWGVLAASGIEAEGEVFHRECAGEAPLFPAALPGPLGEIRIANVAGEALGLRVHRELAARFGIAPRFARAVAVAGNLRSGYANPAQLGVDRWLALRAAWGPGGGAVCVVDAGTATTIDLVDATGQHRGGLILPGLHLMARSLLRGTGELAARQAAAPGGPPADGGLGRDTASAIRLGAIRATACAIADCVETFRRDAGTCRAILTGGDAEALVPWLPFSPELRPRLVLEGLALDPFQEAA